MPLDLEDAIVEALESAGDSLPSPSADLAGRAKRRHRSRRRNRGAAAFVAVALVAGVAYVGGGHHGTTGSPAAFELTGLPLVTDLWPQAIRTLPETLPNGNRYDVIAQVDAETYVVQVALTDRYSGTVYEFDPDRNSLHVLVAPPPSTSLYAAPMRAAEMVDDNRYVAVATNVPYNQPTDVYVASIADGVQVTHVVVPTGDPVPATFGWYDGHIAWSATQAGTIRTDVFSGMTYGIYGPENLYLPIPAASAYAINASTSPWASASSVAPHEFVYDMWNLETGQRLHATHTISPDDGKQYYCLPSGCRLSSVEPHFNDILTVDGVRSTNSLSVTTGRFFVQTDLTSDSGSGSPAVTTVWDMADNAYAILPVFPDVSLDESGAFARSMSVVDLPDDGSHKVILNLAAIPA